jgi:hypothetical protein
VLLTRRLREEGGYTMIAVMAALMAVMGLSVAAFAAADGDQSGARHDQDYKRAYSAAEAGLAAYKGRLANDGEFWTRCNAEPWVNQPWTTGPDNRVRRNVPGVPANDASYAVELLPAPGYTTCDPNNSASMMDTSTGTFNIRSTGFITHGSKEIKRTIVATFRRRGFLDFLYFTDLETSNPVTYRYRTKGLPTTDGAGNPLDVQQWAGDNCSTHYWEPGGWGGPSIQYRVNGGGLNTLDCTEINFATDDAINGPLHSNDELLICGTPTFGRGPQDKIEVSSPAGWHGNTNACGPDIPDFQGVQQFGASVLSPPPSNNELRELAENGGLVVDGRATIQLSGNTLTVNGASKPWPANGVIFVANAPSGTCRFYDPIATENADSACGTALVKGTYSQDLTIAAEADIIVTGPTTRVGTEPMLGLIANNFVRVNHPVNRNSTDPTNCSDAGGTKPNVIHAAILALNYSFIVDNWYCGSQLGDLTVDGAIAQKYRGIVGFIGSTGYKKKYTYDDRLRYRQPPHFLDPVESAWRVLRQAERTPAR